MELIRWSRQQWDRVLGAVGLVVGVALLIVGWIQVSSTEFVAAQIPYVVSAGIGGIVVVMVGGTFWLSADLRDEWRALDSIDEALRHGDEEIVKLRERLSAVEAQQPAAGQVVAARPLADQNHGRATITAGGRPS